MTKTGFILMFSENYSKTSEISTSVVYSVVFKNCTVLYNFVKPCCTVILYYALFNIIVNAVYSVIQCNSVFITVL